MKHSVLFFRKYLKNRRHIASAWPSSKMMCEATIAKVNFNEAKFIVELGAGTGPITRAIVQHMKPPTRLLVIERDPDFVAILQEQYRNHPLIEVIHADVRDLHRILSQRGISQVDYFVSGLSVPLLPEAVRSEMLAAVRTHLRPDGVFSNITEIPLYYWRFYKRFFKKVSFKFVPINIPPGGVYYCQGCGK